MCDEAIKKTYCFGENMKSFVSVIVPTFNSEKTIRDCLRSLSQQTIPHEIIVVDGGSRDRTLSFIPNNVLVVLAPGNQAHAMNAGLNEARGSLVAFLDSDCVAPPKWLETMVKYSKSEVAVGSGNIVNPKDSLFSRLTWRAMGSLVGCGGTTHARNFSHPRPLRLAPSYNSLYFKEVLLELGGFDATLGGGEDVDMGERLLKKGYAIVYVPGAEVWHRGKESVASFFRQMRGFGWSRGSLCKKNPRNLHLVHVLPFFLYALIVFLVVWYPIATIPILLVFLYYGVKFSILERSIRALPLVFIVFPILFIGWPLGLVESIWRKTNRATDWTRKRHTK
jgi:GT2 family glycosyltransferase